MRQELLADFCEALLSVKTTEEAIQFLTDLLTKSEVIMLAKRVQIAKMLIEGKEYRTIEEALRVSHSTIGKVAAWLEESGEGFRLVTERANKKKSKTEWNPEAEEWSRVKRKYPLMFWPQILLEDIVRGANKKQKDQLRRAVEKIDHKSEVYKEMNKMLSAPRARKKYAAT
jgi:TrpR-related protein YerC/YecD